MRVCDNWSRSRFIGSRFAEVLPRERRTTDFDTSTLDALTYSGRR